MTQRIVATAIEAFAGAFIYIPMLAILGKFFFCGVKTTVALSVFAFYISAIYVITGLPNVFYMRPDDFIHLIPFVDMIHDWSNSLLNIVLFVPLGIFLPFLCDKYLRLKNTLAFGFLTTLTIELLQLFTYRKTDINDIITNIAGTFIGFALAKLIIKKFPNLLLRFKQGELYISVAVTVCVMFFLQPLAADLIWSILH